MRATAQEWLDLLLLPRKNDAIVRSITVEELYRLRNGAPREAGRDFEHLIPYRDSRARALIWEMKYRANPRALSLGGALLADALMAIAAEELGAPILIPSPMHRERLRARGYNQAALLCQAAFKHGAHGFLYDPNILMKIRMTRPQQTLARAERLRNLEHSMAVRDARLVRGRTCVVVDDVATTGATFAESRRALQEARAGEIYCVALAG